MTKYKEHPWPTNGATRKYVDRATDRLNNRCDKQTEKIRGLQADIVLLKQHLDVVRVLVVDLSGKE